MAATPNAIVTLPNLPKMGLLQNVAKDPKPLYAYLQDERSALDTLNSTLFTNSNLTVAIAAYQQANAAYTQANLAYAAANAANGVANINTKALIAVANSSNLSIIYESNGQAQIDYVLGQPGGGGGGSDYQVDVYQSGTVVLSNGNLNFNNTNSVNAVLTANGSKQVNVAFTLNISPRTFAYFGYLN